MKTVFYCLLMMIILGPGAQMQAQGYQITVDIPGFTEEELYLAYYLGGKQYIRDTTYRQGDQFVFQGDEPLDAGFYLIVFPPDNAYLQLLVEEDEQDITLQLNKDRLQLPVSVTGSTESKRFYDYVEFISGQRPKAEALSKKMEAANGVEKRDLERQLEAIDDQVDQRQRDIIARYPKSLTAMVIAANREIAIPEFEGTEEEANEKRFRYYREHYFDHIPLHDKRVIRTPFLHERIDYFMEKLTVQSPDSLIGSVDYILSKMDPEGDVFKIYLVHFLNTYAKSKIVGFDAVYVHIANEYYAKGKAPWTDEEQLKKIVDNGRKLDRILIGKTAPNIVVQNQAGEKLELHNLESPYTIMFFWAPDCGHCKKSIPGLIDFYNEYHPKGVEIFAICTKLRDEVEDCWKTIEERGLDIWINTVDPFLRSRYKQIYDIRSTPRVFVLDKDKKIVMKSIAVEQLREVMDRLMEDTP